MGVGVPQVHLRHSRVVARHVGDTAPRVHGHIVRLAGGGHHGLQCEAQRGGAGDRLEDSQPRAAAGHEDEVRGLGGLRAVRGRLGIGIAGVGVQAHRARRREVRAAGETHLPGRRHGGIGRVPRHDAVVQYRGEHEGRDRTLPGRRGHHRHATKAHGDVLAAVFVDGVHDDVGVRRLNLRQVHDLQAHPHRRDEGRRPQGSHHRRGALVARAAPHRVA